MTDTGRNDPCPCGSGAKYKHCCLRTKKKGAANNDLVDDDGWQRRLAQAVNRGYELIEGGDVEAAADIWLDGWDEVRDELPAELSTMGHLERACDGERSMVSWFWKFLGILRGLAADEPAYAARGAEFIGQFLAQFPGESDNNQQNMRADRAWLLAAADRWDEATDEFERLVEEFPDRAVGYVTWADAYLDHTPDGVSKAVELLEKARDRPVDDAGAWDLDTRLDEAKEVADDA